MNLLFYTTDERDLEVHVANQSRHTLPRLGESTLKRFQAYVGGFVEAVSLESMTGREEFRDIDLILNEEGKLVGLHPSVLFVRDGEVLDYIAGNAIFCTVDADGDWVGLSDEMIGHILESLVFIPTSNGILAAIKYKETTP